MAGAFGFTQPNQQPTPDPRAVGQQLMQPRQQQSQAPVAPVDVDPDEAEQAAISARHRMLRREGGKLLGGGGDDSNAEFNQAVGDALTRAGGGHRGNPNPHKQRDRHSAQLMQLGISPLETQLLGEVL